MKIEDAIKSTVTLENDHKIILNIMYTQNVITDKFIDFKAYDIFRSNTMF
jgi:hypothetical protein